VPALVVHGDDDQVVPFSVGGRASAALIANATLKGLSGRVARHHGHAQGAALARPAGVRPRDRGGGRRGGLTRCAERDPRAAVTPGRGLTAGADR
jgi:hypothetical protein